MLTSPDDAGMAELDPEQTLPGALIVPSSARGRGGCGSKIPPRANRYWKNCVSLYLHRDHNAIERMRDAI